MIDAPGHAIIITHEAGKAIELFAMAHEHGPNMSLFGHDKNAGATMVTMPFAQNAELAQVGAAHFGSKQATSIKINNAVSALRLLSF